jgi:hypothetical protein
VDGASVSLMTTTDDRQVVYASDAVIEHVEALQFSLGEGPCFEAFQTRRPVLVPDLATAAAPAWPLFAAELAGHPVRAIFAFPLQFGAIRIGRWTSTGTRRAGCRPASWEWPCRPWTSPPSLCSPRRAAPPTS